VQAKINIIQAIEYSNRVIKRWARHHNGNVAQNTFFATLTNRAICTARTSSIVATRDKLNMIHKLISQATKNNFQRVNRVL
jgi:hypothetical protein